MKLKKIILSVVTATALVVGLGVAGTNKVNNISQTVSAKVKTSHTVPKKFRGKWYMYNSDNSWSVLKFTKKSMGLAETGQKFYMHKVTVKKYSKNKYLIYNKGTKPVYKQYLSISTATYKGKKYKILTLKDKDTTGYRINHKIPVHYSKASGFYN